MLTILGVLGWLGFYNSPIKREPKITRCISYDIVGTSLYDTYQRGFSLEVDVGDSVSLRFTATTVERVVSWTVPPDTNADKFTYKISSDDELLSCASFAISANSIIEDVTYE
jgi:hypothetical protein